MGVIIFVVGIVRLVILVSNVCHIASAIYASDNQGTVYLDITSFGIFQFQFSTIYMYLCLLHVCHIREVEVLSILVLYRLHSGTTAIYVLTNEARLDEYLGVATYRSEVIAFARGIFSERHGSETCTIDVFAEKLAVGFHVGIASYISRETTTMDGLEREAWYTERPRQTAYAIATEGCRVVVCTIVIAAIHTAIIFFLFFLANFLEFLIEAYLEIGVRLEVFFLIEIAVFCSIDGDDTVVIYMATRLCIHRCLSHLGVCTEARTENGELRVGNILAADIPAETRKGGEVEHTEQFAVLVGDVIQRRVVDDYDCFSGTRFRCALSGAIFCCCCVAVGIGTHDAGTVSAAIDIVVLLEASREEFFVCEAEELLAILIVHDSFDSLLCLGVGELVFGFSLLDIFYHLLEFRNGVADFLAVALCCQPGGDIAVDIGILVPYPGTAIHLHLGIAEDVGIGSLVLGILFSEHFLGILVLFRYFYISVAASEDVTPQHTALDMHQGVAVYSAVCTTAIDVVPDVWHGIAVIIESDGIDGCSRSIGNVNDGVAIDATHLVILLSLFSAKTLAATEYRTEDITTDDIHQGAVVCCSI